MRSGSGNLQSPSCIITENCWLIFKGVNGKYKSFGRRNVIPERGGVKRKLFRYKLPILQHNYVNLGGVVTEQSPLLFYNLDYLKNNAFCSKKFWAEHSLMLV